MRGSLRRFCLIAAALLPLSAWAGTAVPFTINLSKAVNVVTSGGTPRIAVDVAGTTRYANYTSGSGTSALVFTYNMVAGDVDLDGVAVSSPVQLNGGTIKDLSGNPLTNLTFTPPNTAGVKVNYPSLGMDFTNGAGGRYTLNGTPYTTLASFLTAAGGSFTRASVGTYYDSAGVLQTATANTPRLDYDPVTHAAKGILIEESRTNLLARSSEFENAAWTKNNATITANATTAPDGTMTADKTVASVSNTPHTPFQVKAITAAASYNVFVKAGEYNFVQMYGGNSGGGPRFSVVVNLTTGAIDTIDNITPSQVSIQQVGGGWYRLSVSNFTGFTSGAAFIAIAPIPSSGLVRVANLLDVIYTGDGTSGIYIWGAQLEQGAFATSYIPTTTAAVTRALDVLSVPTGSWFSDSAASFLTFGDIIGERNDTTGSTPLAFGTANNSSFWGVFASDNRTTIGFLSPNFAFDARYLDMTGKSYRLAGAYSSSYTATQGALNGQLSSLVGITGNIVTNPVTHMSIGITKRNPTIYDIANGHISKVKYYPARVPNTQLQLMTQ